MRKLRIQADPGKPDAKREAAGRFIKTGGFPEYVSFEL
jgi:hypothetical protein